MKSDAFPDLTYCFQKANRKQGQDGGGGGETGDSDGTNWRKIYAATGRLKLDWRPRVKSPVTFIVLEGPLIYPYCSSCRSWKAHNSEGRCSHCRRKLPVDSVMNMDNDEILDYVFKSTYPDLNLFERELLVNEAWSMVEHWHGLVPANPPF